MDRFENVLITALRRAFDVHEVLGEDGLEEVTKNEFGDVALRADVKIEEVILFVWYIKPKPIAPNTFLT